MKSHFKKFVGTQVAVELKTGEMLKGRLVSDEDGWLSLDAEGAQQMIRDEDVKAVRAENVRVLLGRVTYFDPETDCGHITERETEACWNFRGDQVNDALLIGQLRAGKLEQLVKFMPGPDRTKGGALSALVVQAVSRRALRGKLMVMRKLYESLGTLALRRDEPIPVVGDQRVEKPRDIPQLKGDMSQEELVKILRDADNAIAVVDPEVSQDLLSSPSVEIDQLPDFRDTVRIVQRSRWICYYNGVRLTSSRLPCNLSIPSAKRGEVVKKGWYLCSFYQLKGKHPAMLVLSHAVYITVPFVNAMLSGENPFQSYKSAEAVIDRPGPVAAGRDSKQVWESFIAAFESCGQFDQPYQLAGLTYNLSKAGFDYKAFGFSKMTQCVESLPVERVKMSYDGHGHPVICVFGKPAEPVLPQNQVKTARTKPESVQTDHAVADQGRPAVTVPVQDVETSELVMRSGKISAYYPARSHGFLVELTTNQTWFFHVSHISDQTLLEELQKNVVGQEVSFTGSDVVMPGKAYPSVQEILTTSITPVELSVVHSENPVAWPSARIGCHSVFATYKLLSCPYDGIDARVLQTKKFSAADVKGVQFRLDQLYKSRGYIPAELCKYHLTLAALNNKLGMDDVKVSCQLQLYFSLMAQACILDSSSSRETLRFYTIEAMKECEIVKAQFSRSQFHLAKSIYLFVSSYFQSPGFKHARLEEYSAAIPSLILSLRKEPGFEELVRDLPYYKSVIPVDAYKVLEANLPGECFAAVESAVGDKCPWGIIYPLFEGLSALSKSSYMQHRDVLSKILPGLSAPNQVSYKSFLSVFHSVGDYLDKRVFADREIAYITTSKAISDQITVFYREPSALIVDALLPALSRIQELLRNDFSQWESQPPEITIENVLESDGNTLSSDGLVDLKLLISNANISAPPIESLRLSLNGRECRDCYSPEVLGGLQRQMELCLTFEPTEQEVRDKAFVVDVLLSYRMRNEEHEAGPFPVTVRLEQSSLEPIDNPYLAYEGGNPIDEDNPKMFFGRAELVTEIRDLISRGYSGQCFVLYGQKRSGKTSVMKQIKLSLPPDCFYTQISAQEFNYDTENLLRSFAKNVLDQVLETADAEGINLEGMPTFEFAASDPILSLRQISRCLKRTGKNWVLAVDEFTCIYSNNSEQTASFMHAWKALLQGHVFNALIIGQDTMPLFKQAYPNDFCVSHDRRISFLGEEDSAALASEPIFYNGDSRYRGNSLTKIYQKTAGSPYFLQRFCSEMVKYLNEKLVAIITEADVNAVADSLVHGRGVSPLRKEDFDALVTAGDPKLSPVPEKLLWNLLSQIAVHSTNSSWCDVDDLKDGERFLEALEDLKNRDTVVFENGKVRIRVELFADWLRVNNKGVRND